MSGPKSKPRAVRTPSRSERGSPSTGRPPSRRGRGDTDDPGPRGEEVARDGTRMDREFPDRAGYGGCNSRDALYVLDMSRGRPPRPWQKPVEWVNRDYPVTHPVHDHRRVARAADSRHHSTESRSARRPRVTPADTARPSSRSSRGRACSRAWLAPAGLAGLRRDDRAARPSSCSRPSRWWRASPRPCSVARRPSRRRSSCSSRSCCCSVRVRPPRRHEARARACRGLHVRSRSSPRS